MTEARDKLQAAFEPGDPVAGYRIERELGRGGMGVVYLARHVLLDRHVALKTLLPGKLGTATQIERFLKEARLCCRIHHPNVVEVYDAGQHERLYYLVMQYVDGLNLKEVVREQGGPLPWRVALKVMRLATRGTGAMHAHQLIHRDIKPSNIMVSADGRQVVLMDFGLAREELASDLTETGMIVGTPHFMSPEQCLGEALDKRSDIFSLGATLYFLLTAKLPFGGGRVPQIIRDIAAGKPPRPPHEENPFVPRAVSDLVLAAMAHRPGARFADADALGRAIADLLKLPPSADVAQTDTTTNAGAVTASRRVRQALAPLELLPTETVSPWREPKRLWAIAGGIVTLLLLVALMTQVGPGERKPGGRAEGRKGPEATDRAPAPKLITKSEPQPAPVKSDPAAAAASVPAPVPAPPDPALDKPRVAYDPALDNMVEIPAGFVRMGISEEKTRAHFEPLGVALKQPFRNLLADALRARAQVPEERVMVPAYRIDKYEVTNAEYTLFVQTGHRAPDHWPNGRPPPGQEKWPVTRVSYQDAQAYADWAGKKLPTAQQWLRAFRGAEDWLFPWGDTWDPTRANVGENLGFRTMSPVSATPNDVSPFGVFNLVGNAREFLRVSTSGGVAGPVVVMGSDFNSTGAVFGVGPIQSTSVTADHTDIVIGFRCVRE